MNPSTNSQHILNVSDDPAVRHAITCSLAQAGFAVTEVAGAANALREISTSILNLVLLDADLSGVDSHELCSQIRQNPRAAHLPILLFSSQSNNRLARNGSEGCLTWPVSQNVLVTTIESVLRGSQAEARLRKSENGFRATLDQLAVGLGQMTLTGQWDWANRRLSEIFGHSEDGLLQRPCLEALGSEGLKLVLGHKWETEPGEPTHFAFEQRCQRKDGSVFWASWTVSRVRRSGGEAEHLLVVVEDISIRKWTEKNLLLIRAGIEESGEAIAVTDAEGRQAYHNRAFVRLFGYGAEELSGPLAQVALFSDPAVGRLVFAEIKQGHSWQREVQMVAKNGRQFPVELRADPVRDERSQLIGFIAAYTDLTERRQLEGQLRQAQRMEAIGQLAGGVAHDFNNMLAVIRGNADVLLMDSDQFSAATSEGLRNIINASEKAANLTRQLLVFSRKQAMESQTVAVHELARDMMKMLRRTIREDIRFECHYAEPLPCVRADPGMLEQVLLNLVVNARDAMPQGGLLRIAIEKTSVDSAHAQANPEARVGEFICLSVTDTGSGIAPENLQRIFDPFFTTKEPDRGTGLGLATAYGLVKQHEGWIEVSSQLGSGARFDVFLPAISSPIRVAVVRAMEPGLRRGTEGILLVEDDFAILALTRRLLESCGYRVWTAESADAALEIWRTRASEVDLLLTDLVTPGTLSGSELATRVQQEKPGLKVIFMSGYSPDTVRGQTDFGYRLNARFLQKPCGSSTLLETVRTCLDESTAKVA